jgi:hypothetical protein
LNELKRIFSIIELANKLSCSENTVIDYIESGELPVYVKSYIVSYEAANARLKITILRRDARFSNQLVSLLDELRSKNIPDNEDILDLKDAVNVTLGDYIKLEDEDIAYASLDDYSQCFVCLKDVEKFEQNFVKSQELDKNANTESSILELNIKRENDFNSCLAEVIKEFISANEYPPTVDEVLHRLNLKPPNAFRVILTRKDLSIEGSSPRKLDNVRRTIKKLLHYS